MGRRTSNIVITLEFQFVVVAPTTWFCAIGKRIATSKNPIIMSTTIDSEIALRFHVCARVIDSLMWFLTLDMARVAMCVSRDEAKTI